MSLARQTLSNSVLADQPIPALLERFDELTQQAQALEQQAGQLIEHWRSRSRTLPFYLARLSGESLTLLRWRRRADTAGCGGRRFELLDDAADEAAKTQREANRAALATNLDLLKKNGMQVTTFAPAEVAKLRDKMKPVIAQFSANVGEATVTEVMGELAKMRR